MSARYRFSTLALVVGCLSDASTPLGGDALWAAVSAAQIPGGSDWIDYGTILENGALGDWDFQLFGSSGLSVVKRGGVSYLYFMGACCYRGIDDSVAYRAIGVATSPDGVNFTKHAGNPVLSWWPTNGGEEGAVSIGATLDSGGEVVAYYGANTEIGPTSVSADGRLATSANGVDFTDQGIVLDRLDPAVWGSGDELFPIIAFEDQGSWYVYYFPNGSPQGGRLGVAWGASQDLLTSSAGVQSGGSLVAVRGAGSAVRLDDGTLAMFLNHLPSSTIEVRIVDPSTPDQVSAPVETYSFPAFRQGIVFADEDRRTWFLYYRELDRYGVKLAPIGAPDTSPPTAPPNVGAVASGHDRIDLSWDPASDGETGIVHYRLFRNGQPIATVKGWSFTDGDLNEGSSYSYEVAAVNLHGLQGPRSTAVPVTTLADTAPPRLVGASASGDPGELIVIFDEPVDPASSETAGNYTLSGGLSVQSANLATDLRTVTLTVSPHLPFFTYTVTVVDVRDRAQVPNAISTPVQMSYGFDPARGLVGSWNFDEGQGSVAGDSANFSHDGSLVYPGKTPATWTQGKVGGALHFDGTDDLVVIPAADRLDAATAGSHTFSAWVRPQDVPQDTAAIHDGAYSVMTRRHIGLFYESSQRFRAEMENDAGAKIAVRSPPLVPGVWHHLAMVVDAIARRLHLFVDGQEVAGSPVGFSGSPADLSPADYLIGTSNVLAERWDFRLRGWIDEAHVYDRDLTASEIQALVQGATSFVLQVQRSGTGSGTITSSPAGIDCGTDCSMAYPSGTVVTLTATPDFSSTFSGWSGDPDCGDGQVTMDSAKTCTAAFDLTPTPTHALTVSKSSNGSGTVTSSPAGIDCGSDCSQDYDEGTVVTLTATPEADSRFGGWSGDADCADGEVTMDSAILCTAIFDLDVYTLTVAVTGSGSGSVTSAPAGIDCGTDCSEAYPAATEVTLTALTSGDSFFAGWDGDADCEDGITTMSTDRSCIARFELFGGQVFSDGFETGDTSEWSADSSP